MGHTLMMRTSLSIFGMVEAEEKKYVDLWYKLFGTVILKSRGGKNEEMFLLGSTCYRRKLRHER